MSQAPRGARVLALLTGAIASGAVGLLSAQQPQPSTVADPVDLGKVVFRVFTDRDGLPQNSVEGMAFSARGYLWACTRDGAARFDGASWRPVRMPDPSRSNWPRAVVTTPDGAVWFGTEGAGVQRLLAGSWTAYDQGCGLPSDNVRSLALAGPGSTDATLWVGTSEGLASIGPAGCRRITAPGAPSDERVTSILETPDGTLWVGTDGAGLYRRRAAGWTRLTSEDGLPGDRVFALLPAPSSPTGEGVLAGTSEGLAEVAAGVVREVGFAMEGRRPTVRALLGGRTAGGQSVLWIGTEGDGLYRLQGSHASHYGTRSGLPSEFVYSLAAVDSAAGTRTVLVGTLTGLAQLEATSWVAFDQDTGLPDNTVVSLAESAGVSGQGDRIWFGTTGGGLAALEAGTWRIWDAASGLGDDSAFTILPTLGRGRSDALWVGTSKGLARLAGGRWSHLTRDDGLPDDPVVALLEPIASGPAGDLWIGTYGGGLALLEDDELSVFDAAAGALPDDRVEALLETADPSGAPSLWVATDGGLVRRSGGAWRRWTRADGLPNDVVRSLHVTTWPGGERTLWVGTGAGLAWTDPDGDDLRWSVISGSTEPALPNDVVYRIEEDALGRIYLGTNHGVVRLDPRRVPPETAGDFELVNFTVADGLPGNECSFGASMVDGDGRVWFGMVGGAAVFDPSREVPDHQPKPLIIEEATVAGTDRPLRSGEELAHEQAHVVFQYTLLSFFRGADATFRTQLEGFDAAPSGWSRDRKRSYTNLRAGDYVFKVWGRDYVGNVSGPEVLPFSVAPSPWRSWWAVLLYVLAAAAVLAGVVRLRVATLRRRTEELEDLVADRTLELATANRALEEMSVTDPLTGAHNRRFLDEWLPEELARVRGAHAPGQRSTADPPPSLLFLVVDIDHFKQVNDTFGHLVGDDVLQQLYPLLKSTVREGDTVVRWGGEEFLVVARVGDRGEGRRIAERIRSTVAARHFETPHGVELRVTCSVGFAPYPFRGNAPDALDWEDVVAIADACMYAAKHSGRNAWVGVSSGARGDSSTLMWRLRRDIRQVVDTGELVVETSLGAVDRLQWDAPS